MKKTLVSIFSASAILLASCATTYNPTQNPPGFLPDYSLLKAVDGSPDGTQIFTYKNPYVDADDYYAGIIEPVTIYEGATSESGVTSAQIANAKLAINNGIIGLVKRKYKITNKPGSGVFRLNVAITGATLEKDSFKPWNVIPVSAAIKLGSMATGLDNKTPFLVVEIKVTDSKSGQLLKETVSTIKGDSFRMSSSTPEEFNKLAGEWVNQAIKYKANN
jgi:hypothetical protein